MAKDITNKVVVITGASQGIGFDTAKEFLQQGAKNVIILDINEDVGANATDTLNRQFGKDKVTFFKCDVTTDLDTTFNKILGKFKTFDVLINNAGIYDEHSIRRVLAVNTIATVEWTMKFWDHVRKDKGGNGGTVINVASIYGYMVDPFSPYYKCSKYAVVGFTRTIGHKINHEQTGVRVIAVCPSFTKTTMADNIVRNKNQEYQIDISANFKKKVKLLDPLEVSKAIAQTFKLANSGTVWSIINGEPSKEVPVPPGFYSEYLIKVNSNIV